MDDLTFISNTNESKLDELLTEVRYAGISQHASLYIIIITSMLMPSLKARYLILNEVNLALCC